MLQYSFIENVLLKLFRTWLCLTGKIRLPTQTLPLYCWWLKTSIIFKTCVIVVVVFYGKLSNYVV